MDEKYTKPNLEGYHFIPGYGLYEWLRETETGKREYMNMPEQLIMIFYHVGILIPIGVGVLEIGDYIKNLF